jgi:PleD family two-component response regulator
VTRPDLSFKADTVFEPQTRSPLILIASDAEWMSRSFESVFELNGYTVMRVESGRRALELARRATPDAVLLDDCFTDIDAVEVCRALRDDPLFNHATPIVITAAANAAPRMRNLAYAAGAWEYCSQPLDVEQLLLKLGTYLRARRELDTVQEHLLVDPLTGLYTPFGMQRIAEQLGARAVRKHEAFACVAITPRFPDNEIVSPSSLQDLGTAFADVADVCRSQSRRSDVIGSVGESRLAILAPETDDSGARNFVGRLQKALDEMPTTRRGRSRASGLRAGYCAVSDLATAKMGAGEVVRRAETALEHAQTRGSEREILSFDEIPVG